MFNHGKNGRLVFAVLDFGGDFLVGVVQHFFAAVIATDIDFQIEHLPLHDDEVAAFAELDVYFLAGWGCGDVVFAEEDLAFVCQGLVNADFAFTQRTSAEAAARVVDEPIGERQAGAGFFHIPRLDGGVEFPDFDNRNVFFVEDGKLLGFCVGEALGGDFAARGYDIGFREVLAGKVAEHEVFLEADTIFLWRDVGPIGSEAVDVVEQIADAQLEATGIGRCEFPDDRGGVGWVGDPGDFDVTRSLDDGEEKGVRVDIDAGPGEVDLVGSFLDDDGALFLDEGRLAVVEVDGRPLAFREGDEFGTGRGRHDGQGRE